MLNPSRNLNTEQSIGRKLELNYPKKYFKAPSTSSNYPDSLKLPYLIIFMSSGPQDSLPLCELFLPNKFFLMLDVVAN